MERTYWHCATCQCSSEAEGGLLRKALQTICDKYRRSADAWRPSREFANDYQRGWRDGHNTALAECSIIARGALDPEGTAENDALQAVACHGTDEEWYRQTGYCGGCGTIADSCECKGDCGCWELHGPPPEPWESPLDRAVRERDEIVKAARDVPVQHEAQCAAWVRLARCDCRVADLNAALARLDGELTDG